MAGLAIYAGDPEKLTVLLEYGATVSDPGSDDGPLGLASRSRGAAHNPRLLELLRLLIAQGVKPDGALQHLCYWGRFDAVKLLLDAGADESQLGWTPLIRAAALGTADDVRALLDAGITIDDRDRWSRTAFLVAIRTGDIGKAALLLERGADPAKGHWERPLVFDAIEGQHAPMLRWLLDQGAPAGDMDQFGNTALHVAAENDNLEAIGILSEAGLDPTAAPDPFKETPLRVSATARVARRLLEAGADPAGLDHETRRMLAGLEREPNLSLFDATQDEFDRWRTRRFGTRNPEPMDNPFWLAMIRSGINAYQAASAFGAVRYDLPPVWCAQRFGQSITFLPDGSIVQIGGEHEDAYDPDFCIYNDVFVHRPDGEIRVYGYPEELFPPTDFHTATLIGRYIYVIGSVGYVGARGDGTTPLCRLDTVTWKMERLEASGEAPGWIYKHRADACGGRFIEVRGGTTLTALRTRETHEENTGRFVLDTQRLVWSRAT
jgi:ankyrin repeat protein